MGCGGRRGWDAVESVGFVSAVCLLVPAPPMPNDAPRHVRAVAWHGRSGMTGRWRSWRRGQCPDSVPLLPRICFPRLAVWAWCRPTRSFFYWLRCQWALVRVWLYRVHRTCWRMSGVLVVRVSRLLARASNYKPLSLFHCRYKSGELVGRNVRFPVLPTSYGIFCLAVPLLLCDLRVARGTS